MSFFSLGRQRPRSALVFALVALCALSYAQAAVCGDGVCATAPGSEATSCPKDCNPTCGDGVCATSPAPAYASKAENVSNCKVDCNPTCGDGICTTTPFPGYTAENAASCPKDCSSPVCGDGVCSVNPLTGTAESTSNCARDCIAICGDGTCTTAPINGTAENASNCAKDCDPACGDGLCSTSPPAGYSAESSSNCPKDCGPAVCGDRVCALNPVNGSAESVASCPQDCSCGDGYCDIEFESCFWCDDCSCSFDGVRVRVWEKKAKNVNIWVSPAVSLPTQISSSSKIELPSSYVDRSGPLYVVMDGYLQVNVTQHYTFQLVTKNIGASFKINGHKVLDLPAQEDGKSTIRVVLQKEYIHRVLVEVQSFSNLSKSIALHWKISDNSEFKEFTESFYSYNVCGDHIFDKQAEMILCPTDDKLNKTFNAASDTCGDGLCLERFPETCFMDCYTEISKICSPIAVPPGHISAGLPVRDDTFGSLIRNQMLWHLPGMEHMSYGFDIVKGEQSLYPLFYFGYCDDKSFSTVQDTYRGNVYTIPEELFAQPLPKCSFSVDSSTYSSASKLAESMSQEISIDVSLSASVDVGLYSGSGSLAFSGSRAVKSALELETKSSGAVIISEIKCATSQVKIAKYNFHPSFLEELAKVRNVTQMVALVKKYGSHIYSSAILGGKLQQITTMSKTFQSSKTQKELEEHAELSLSASVSGPAFSGSGSFSGSVDSTTSEESQRSYEGSSFRSSVITYGGPPGSFGPTTSDAPSNFGDWASSIDLLPVPIDYTLKPIYDAIPDTWTIEYKDVTGTTSTTSVRNAWIEAQRNLYSSQSGFRLTEGETPVKYTMWWFWDQSFKSATNIDENTKFYLNMSNSTSSVILPILDQQPGRAGTYSFKNFSLPLRFDFYIPTSFSLPTSIYISSNLPTYKTPNTRDFYDGERRAELFVHNWDNGLGWWANNYKFTAEYNSVDQTVDFHYYWSVADESVAVYQMNLEIRLFNGSYNDRGKFEVSFEGVDPKIRDTTTWVNGLFRDYENTKAIKMYFTSRPQLGALKKVYIRLSALAQVQKEQASTYMIKNVWIQVPSCNSTTFSQTGCSTSKNFFVFHSNPEREFALSTFSSDLIEIDLLQLDKYNF